VMGSQEGHHLEGVRQAQKPQDASPEVGKGAHVREAGEPRSRDAPTSLQPQVGLRAPVGLKISMRGLSHSVPPRQAPVAARAWVWAPGQIPLSARDQAGGPLGCLPLRGLRGRSPPRAGRG
jgi:hypothetical protein